MRLILAMIVLAGLVGCSHARPARRSSITEPGAVIVEPPPRHTLKLFNRRQVGQWRVEHDTEMAKNHVEGAVVR